MSVCHSGLAGLRDSIGTIEDLHRSVSEGASEHLSHVTLPEDTRRISRGIDDPYDIAVVGMACVFPGSPSLESYWRMITTGSDTIREVPRERWNPDIYFDPDGRPGYTTPSKWGGFIDAVDIDPMAYGIPPKAMAAIEPVQLLSLEIARRALDGTAANADAEEVGRKAVPLAELAWSFAERIR